jgi:hypothetical protein
LVVTAVLTAGLSMSACHTTHAAVHSAVSIETAAIVARSLLLGLVPRTKTADDQKVPASRWQSETQAPVSERLCQHGGALRVSC